MLPWIQQYTPRTPQKTAIRTGMFLVAVFLCLQLFFPSDVLAQAAPDAFNLETVRQETSLSGTDIRVVIARIIQAVLGLIGIVAVVLILYSGYLIMTSAGNEEKVAEGKKVLINSIIGLVIILSSLAITQFVIGRLSDATGLSGGAPGGGRGPSSFQTFASSGSLGRVIRDHYPFRDATEVPRNVQIAVTFREAIDPRSIMDDTNGDGIFGNCLTVPAGTRLDRGTQCDQVRSGAVNIIRTGFPASPVRANVFTEPGSTASSTYTFVFQPLELLGTSSTTVAYTVTLTGQIRKADGRTSAFVSDRDGQYVWNFETSISLDLNPPFVESVYPANRATPGGAPAPRNSIVQITFSEPVNPTMVQGRTGTFFNILFGAAANIPLPQGEWRISNGYRTVEFVSNEQCGQNSCGDPMYCLPVRCTNPADTNCRNNFALLIRTAALADNREYPFQAAIASGVMDMAGNALDSGPEANRDPRTGVLRRDGVPANRPQIPDRAVITPNVELSPDNYWWTIEVQNTIDRSAPYIQNIIPNIDEEDVSEDKEVSVLFSKPMWIQTFDGGIGLEEHPATSTPFWAIVRAEDEQDGGQIRTRARFEHRIFGPNGADMYYFPSISSSVKSVTQNCMYPGRGPYNSQPGQSSPTCVYEEDAQGIPVPNTGTGCAPVTSDSARDTACAQTSDSSLAVQPRIADCLNALRRPEVSPPPQPGRP